MSPFRSARHSSAAFAALALAVTLGACARSDAKPPEPRAGTVAVASGDVAPKAPAVGLAGGLTDSTSARADRGRIKGTDGAQVWLIEISDFQCPYCKSFHDETSPIIDREYVQTGKVRRAFINYPISRIHVNARGAAETAMCASAQGKFWEVQDALFRTQARWGDLKPAMPVFDSLVVASGADAAAWRSCMESHATLPLIDADYDRATKAGVHSTPSFFVGSRALIGAYPIDMFRVVLDSAIKAHGGR